MPSSLGRTLKDPADYRFYRPPEAHITAVEPDLRRAATLRAAEVADEVVEATLEDYLNTVAVAALTGFWTLFDLVVMNPPFTLPGRPRGVGRACPGNHRRPSPAQHARECSGRGRP